RPRLDLPSSPPRRSSDLFGRLGIGVSPDDCVLVLRGIETLAVRLSRSSASAGTLASWLSDHPLVDRVLFPALPLSVGHDIWKREDRKSTRLNSSHVKISY